MKLFTAIIIGLLFGIGVYQLFRRSMLRSAIGLVILSNAVNLFLLAAGAYDGVRIPYVGVQGQKPDVLPQALVLTAIVISMGGFAFILALIYVQTMRRRSVDVAEMNTLKH